MRLKRFVDRLPLIIAMFALVGAIWAIFGQDDDPARLPDDQPVLAPPDVNAEDSPERVILYAQAAIREAQQASNAADVILGFIESGSIIIGALIALTAVVFGLSIQDVRSRLEGTEQEAEERLKSSEKRIDDLVTRLEQQLREGVEADNRRAREFENRMQVLSLRVEETLRQNETQIAGMQGAIDLAVESARQEAENSFRVLSVLLLAEQQVRANNRDTAIATLQEAFHLDPNNQTTNYLLGYLYVGRKRFNEAVDHLERALKVDANFAPALAAMGLAQRRMGDYIKDNPTERNLLWSQAEHNLLSGLKNDPGLLDADNESYFGTLGGLYRRQGRLEEARRAYMDAVKITPNNSYPIVNLATLSKKLNYEEDAQIGFQRVIEIAKALLDDQPSNIWPRLDMAQALLVTRETDAALLEYQTVINRSAEAGPLEVALSGLEFLADAPVPIPGLEDVTTMLREEISKRQKKGVFPPAGSPSDATRR